MTGSGLPGFLAELKRRRVVRVALVYALVAWIVIEVADTILPRLALPEWTVTFVVVLAVLGAPIALVLAWAFELSPDGVRRTDSLPDATPAAASRAPAWLGLGVIVALVGIGAIVYLGPEGDAADLDRSVAVLPFADMSPESNQSYLADGITEDILTKLAALPGFRVPSRTSAMQYKGTTKDMPTIGRELGVAWVLEGSVRRDGDRVKITGQLIRADTDEHVWAENYERPLTDIFAVQNEIAEKIADALEVELTARDRSRLAGHVTDDPEAYDLYLRGREALLGAVSSLDDLQRDSDEAVALFRQALARDPDYALAYVGLARAYWGGPDFDIAAHTDSVVSFSRRAIRLDPDIADGYVALAGAYLQRGEWVAAREQLDYALELNPNHPDALEGVALSQLESGQLLEARRTLDRALAVDPADPDLHDMVARVYQKVGDYDRAEHWFRRAHEELRPHPGRLACELGGLAIQRGERNTARAHLNDLIRLEPEQGQFGFGCAGWLAYANRDFAAAATHYRRAHAAMLLPFLIPLFEAIGDDQAVRRALAAAEESIATSSIASPAQRAYYGAFVAAWRGDVDEALRRLVAAHGTSQSFREFEHDPAWDRFRDDPRFQAFLAETHADADSVRTALAREGF